MERNPPLAHFALGRKTARGRFFVGEPVAMHRPGAKVPFDGMGFPLILADSLRAAFADFGSTPLPEGLAALMRRLSDREDRSGEPNHGASATET